MAVITADRNKFTTAGVPTRRRGRVSTDALSSWDAALTLRGYWRAAGHAGRACGRSVAAPNRDITSLWAELFPEDKGACVHVRASPYLATTQQARLLQSGPDALHPPSVFRVNVSVTAHALVLQHQAVIYEP